VYDRDDRENDCETANGSQRISITAVQNVPLVGLPRLAEVAGAAVFAASEQGVAMTVAVVNLTCGGTVD
jgi:hypothetical protein